MKPSAEAALQSAIPGLTDEIISAVREHVPAYDRPLLGRFGDGVRRGTEQGVARFLDEVAGRHGPAFARREVYVELGRGEMAAGRSLETVLAAYRVAARVVWRRVSAAGRANGMGPEELSALAELLFAYIDELSAETADGFAQAQADRAGERERRRSALVELLSAPGATTPAALAERAEEAGWPLPRVIVPLAAGSEWRRTVRGRLPTTALVGEVGGDLVVLLPGPAPSPAALARVLDGASAALGSPAPAEGIAESLARAQHAARMQRAGMLPEGIVVADDHLLDLALFADPARADRLAERALAPLDALTPNARARLTATLGAWLDAGGNVAEAARAIHVHPQTLRYRLRQLEELLGPALTEPDGRLTLAVAVRVRRATRG